MKPLRIAVAGAMGRMGRAILNLAGKNSSFSIRGALESASHPLLGENLSNLLGIPHQNSLLTDRPEAALKPARVLITFTNPRATMDHVDACLRWRKALVIGTTGLASAQVKRIQAAAKKIPILFSPNMSVGVNLLLMLTALASKKLGPAYDLEIVESHHGMKKDAPSGTALKIAEVAAFARGVSLDKVAVYGRKGMTGARKRGTIGIHAVRGGDVIGEHTVEFMAAGERIGLFHKATSRDAFASGALLAAQFVAKKKNGLWSMKDVLDI
ncbi:MAG: 4-hydroxy-tetrahydrodipicolinate reductase [Candidatus Omnitrophica bacterium]|nr:4-hydroxy-tetrahydrodipicolinate reductase [Candidatus Omnitrophota bacterium]